MFPHGQGATLAVIIEGASLTLGILYDGALVAETIAELALQERTREQAVAALIQLLTEKGPSFLESYKASGGHRIRSILIVLYAPFAEAQIVSAIHSFPADHAMTDAVLDACAREALKDLPQQPGFLSASMLQSRLNGYPTGTPEGKYARTVELVGIAARTSSQIKDRLLAAAHALAPSAAVVIKPGALALIEASRRISKPPPNALILYLAREETVLVIIREGVPDFCGSIPIGLRHIAEFAFPNQSPEALLSALRLVSQNAGSDVAAADANNALAAIEPKLAQQYGEAFAALSSQSRLPGHILLAAPPEALEWFTHFLTRIDFAPFTFTAQPFQVTTLLVPQPRGAAHATSGIGLAMALLLLAPHAA